MFEDKGMINCTCGKPIVIWVKQDNYNKCAVQHGEAYAEIDIIMQEQVASELKKFVREIHELRKEGTGQ